MQSLLINPSSEWFNLNVYDRSGELKDVPEVLLWCQMVQKEILNVFNYAGTNFYAQAYEFFLTLTAYGTAIFYVEEDLSLPHALFFKNIDLRECYIEDNRFGFVDSMYRLFKMPVRVAYSKWPENIDLKEKAEKEPNEKVEILHIVTKDENKKNVLEYTSEYILYETRKVLNSAGYPYFPFLVTRWIKSNEPYGFSPSHHVLPDIKLLNKLRKLCFESGQKQIRPALLAPLNGLRLPLKTTPGSINYYENTLMSKITPLMDTGNKMSTIDEEEQCKDAILKAFYIDIFRMQKENKEMTATEVQVRTEEQMRMMSPIVSRIESEFLNPLIMSVYKVLQKYDMIPSLDIISRNAPKIDIEYTSPLTRAQKLSSITSIEQILGFFQRSGIANISPEVYDNLDWDKVMRLSFELRGAPQLVLKGEKEVEQIRSQRQAMIQEAGLREQQGK